MASVAGVLLRVPAAARWAGRRWTLLLAVVVAVAGGYFAWLRDSSLVAVRSVHVEGLPAGQRALHGALEQAARGMTTLHVREDDLRAAVAYSPLIADVDADPSLPSSLTVRVRLRPPVAVARVGGRPVPIGPDGTLMRGVAAARNDLPQISVLTKPREGRLTGRALDQALLVGAAPPPLRRLIESGVISGDGVTLVVAGIELRFGDADRRAAKWAAAAAVLADPALEALDYVDLRAPTRPTVGGETHALPPVE